MKKIGILCLVLAMILALPLPAGAMSVSQGADTLDAMVPLEAQQPEGTTAQAIILILILW